MKLSREERTAYASPALTKQSEHYPARFEGRVPWKVRVLKNVHSFQGLPVEIIMALTDGKPSGCFSGDVFLAETNSHGAVSAVLPGTIYKFNPLLCDCLGLKPDEYEVVEWMEFEKTTEGK
jgi:hypothetical protein